MVLVIRYSGLGDCADFGEDNGGSANFSDDVGVIWVDQ